MELNEFYRDISDIHLEFNEDLDAERKYLLSNEVLFQLPFLSMVILLLAKQRSKPKVPEIGELVGKCLEDSMPTFKNSHQLISWSANLRIRTVNAMQILEIHKLISIDNQFGKLHITDLGKKIITKAISGDDDLSWNLSSIEHSYYSIRKQQNFELKV